MGGLRKVGATRTARGLMGGQHRAVDSRTRIWRWAVAVMTRVTRIVGQQSTSSSSQRCCRSTRRPATCEGSCSSWQQLRLGGCSS